jgi:hypothetical protein
MVDISALLSDQPLIDEGGSEGDDENQLDAIEGTGADYTGSGDEPPEGDEDGGDPPAQRNQKVPLAALHEERTKRQELEQRTREQQALIDKANERLAKLFEAQQQVQQPQQTPQEAVPAFTDDPEAAFNHVQRQLAETQRQMQEYVQNFSQQQAQQQQHVQLAQQVSVQEAQFTQSVPDYPTAADYFYQRKVAEYQAFTGDELAAKQQVAKDYQGIAQLAQRLGKNPAELMYNAAKAMGYVPGQQQRAPQGGNLPKSPPTSLANAHGSTRAPDEKGAITAADIANMSEKEFDDFFNGMARKGIQRPKI